MLDASAVSAPPRKKRRINWRKVKINWQLYLLLAPALAYFAIFKYYPMYGLQIAFKYFRAVDGIWGSRWIGFEHFERFFNSYYFWDLIKNTLFINLYALALFPISIIVALSLNELRDGSSRRSPRPSPTPPLYFHGSLGGHDYCLLGPCHRDYQ